MTNFLIQLLYASVAGVWALATFELARDRKSGWVGPIMAWFVVTFVIAILAVGVTVLERAIT